VKRVYLIHWNPDEARPRIEVLEEAGYETAYVPQDGPAALRSLREDPPDAVVIDLSRLPSHGRDMGLALRSFKATRRVPLIFVEGPPEKVDRIRELLPDAHFTTWNRIRSAVKQAIAHPPEEPVVPGSVMEGYSGAPLVKKLGIGRGSRIVLLRAPKGFRQTLGSLPDGARIRGKGKDPADVVLLFATSPADLEKRFPEAEGILTEKGKLWIAWPKKRPGVASGLTQKTVRAFGLASGFVDYKICSIDDTWSGLCFARRKKITSR